MALLLHIDTATASAGICLSENEQILSLQEHHDSKTQASFLQPSIEKLMKDCGKKLQELDAVCVTGGPGSYTGIRVGLASAKGICFALNKPLIVLNTLQVIAKATMEDFFSENKPEQDTLLIPMIDARRMEVFGGIYDINLISQSPSAAYILDADFFESLPYAKPIVFCGDGAHKILPEFVQNNRMISTVRHQVNHLIKLGHQAYLSNNFADLAYTEPLYVKEFYDTGKH